MRKIKEIIRDENIILLSIFLLSLALRISYLLVVKEDVLVLEEFSYFDIGADLAEGKGFGLNGAKFAPLYPLFLAPIYFLFGEFKAEVAIKAIQLILGSFSSVFIFLAARRIFNVKVGLISAFIFAFYDEMFFLNVHLLPENLIIPLELLLLLFLLRHYQGKKKTYHINMVFSGLLTGLLFLVAPLTSILIPFLILWIVLFLPKRLLISLLFPLLIGLTICPWAIRNHLLIDSNTKEIFFKYNYPYGVSRLYLYKEREAEPDLSEIFAFIKKNPGEYFDFFSKKLCFNLKNFLFSEKIWFEAAAQKPGISIGNIKTSIPLISWKMLSLFGLLGAFLALKLWPRTSLLYSFCGAWLASILILFAGFPRFRLPLVPFFIIFSSFGVYSIFRLVGNAHLTRRQKLCPEEGGFSVKCKVNNAKLAF